MLLYLLMWKRGREKIIKFAFHFTTHWRARSHPVRPTLAHFLKNLVNEIAAHIQADRNVTHYVYEICVRVWYFCDYIKRYTDCITYVATRAHIPEHHNRNKILLNRSIERKILFEIRERGREQRAEERKNEIEFLYIFVNYCAFFELEFRCGILRFLTQNCELLCIPAIHYREFYANSFGKCIKQERTEIRTLPMFFGLSTVCWVD